MAGQGGEIHAEHVGQLEQHRRRDGALVVLDQVEIAGRDAEPGGERLLGHRALAAQAADGAADQGAGHDFPVVREGHILQTFRILA
jgi:hypothetical protein